MGKLSLTIVILLAACGGGGGNDDMATPPDMTAAAQDMTMGGNVCGPGELGNSKGVGKYCTGATECMGNGSATVCSALFHPGTNFCTLAALCTPNASGMDPATCGENTYCQCDPNLGCGCTPAACGLQG